MDLAEAERGKNLLSERKLTFLPLTRIQIGHFYH